MVPRTPFRPLVRSWTNGHLVAWHSHLLVEADQLLEARVRPAFAHYEILARRCLINHEVLAAIDRPEITVAKIGTQFAKRHSQSICQVKNKIFRTDTMLFRVKSGSRQRCENGANYCTRVERFGEAENAS